MPQPVYHQTLHSDEVWPIKKKCSSFMRKPEKLREQVHPSNKQTECTESTSGAQCLNRLLFADRAGDDAPS